MKVLLINPNRKKPAVMPIGLMYLTSYLKNAGFQVNFLDLCFEKEVDLEKEVQKLEPDLIGIGIRNIDNVIYTQTEFFVSEIKNVIEDIRSFCQIPIVVGGAGYSIFPLEIYETLNVEYGIVGEGEKSIYLLCQALQSEGSFAKIPGLVYKEAGKVIINALEPLTPQELEELPFPSFTVIDTPLYYQDGGVASIQTKRGCALNCVYCTYPIVEGKNFRLRPAKSVVQEMKLLLENHQLRYFYFVDSIFNVPFSHAEKICDEIIKENLDINWFGYVSPKGFTEARLKKMIDSGVDGIWFSLDTCSESMLQNMGKSFTLEDVRQAIELCQKANVRYNFVLLLGGPGETVETLMETFAFLEEFDPNLAVILYGLRIYPGTVLEKIALEEGIITEKTDLLEPIFYLAPQVKDLLIDVIKEKTKDHPNWHATSEVWNRREQLKNILMERKVQELYAQGVRGPFWAVIDKIQNNLI